MTPRAAAVAPDLDAPQRAAARVYVADTLQAEYRKIGYDAWSRRHEPGLCLVYYPGECQPAGVAVLRKVKR